MFEKYEPFIILSVIALAIYYFFKGATGAGAQSANPGNFFTDLGSLVNPTKEVGAVNPAQTTTPVLFRPAQPAAASQMVRVGSLTNVRTMYPPVTRGGMIYQL
jgi:hypothetical protein